MLRACVLTLALLVSAAGSAQQPAPIPPPQTTPDTRPRLTDDQRAKLRADRDACRTEVRAQDLPRGERRGAMRRCIEARNPDLKPLFARGEARRPRCASSCATPAATNSARRMSAAPSAGRRCGPAS